MPKPVLLTVDDDPEVLRAVERDLRKKYADRYRVVRADSGATALQSLETLKKRNEAVASAAGRPAHAGNERRGISK